MKPFYALGFACGLLLGPMVAGAQSEIFRFVDKQGVFHFTDRLADVPEPYYSYYRARQREREAKAMLQGNAVPSTPSPVRQPSPLPAFERPSGPSLVEQEEQRRLMWKGLVARWREELANAMTALEDVRSQRDQETLNPVLSQTPEVQARIAELDLKEAAALAKLERARKALAEDLPARAKRENASPKWLE